MEKKSTIEKWFEGFKRAIQAFKKEEMEFSAELAFFESTHGEGTFKPLDARIVEKQNYIKRMIKNRFPNLSEGYGYHYSSYHCVIDIEPDIIQYADRVFKPFIDGGFEIINLSEKVTEIKENGVYLISWKNAFNVKD